MIFLWGLFLHKIMDVFKLLQGENEDKGMKYHSFLGKSVKTLNYAFRLVLLLCLHTYIWAKYVQWKNISYLPYAFVPVRVNAFIIQFSIYQCRYIKSWKRSGFYAAMRDKSFGMIYGVVFKNTDNEVKGSCQENQCNDGRKMNPKLEDLSDEWDDMHVNVYQSIWGNDYESSKADWTEN